CQAGNSNISKAIDIKNPEARRACGATADNRGAVAVDGQLMTSVWANLRKTVNPIIRGRKRVRAAGRQFDRVILAVGVGRIDGVFESDNIAIGNGDDGSVRVIGEQNQSSSKYNCGDG